MVRRKPTMRAVWLGRALRGLREGARLTVRQFGDRIGKDGSTVSRVESGEQPVSIEVLDGYLEHCAVDDPQRRSDLLTIRSDVALDGWWDAYRKDISPSLMDRVWLESKATRINSFETMVLPGLLQLPEYSEALMRRKHPDAPDGEIKRWAEVRMQRQHIVSRHDPVQLNCIVDASVLRRSCGDIDIMKKQLDYLIEVNDHPNVSLRVLPSHECTGIEGSFELFQLTEPYPEVGYVATPAGDICLEETKLDRLRRAYTEVERSSHPPAESRDVIAAERDRL